MSPAKPSLETGKAKPGVRWQSGDTALRGNGAKAYYNMKGRKAPSPLRSATALQVALAERGDTALRGNGAKACYNMKGRKAPSPLRSAGALQVALAAH